VMMSTMVSNALFSPYVIGSQEMVYVSHIQLADETLLVGVKSWADV